MGASSGGIPEHHSTSGTNAVYMGRNGGCYIPGAIVVAIGTSIIDSAIVIGVSDGNVTRPGRISKGVARDCEILHDCGSCIDTIGRVHAMHNMIVPRI